VYGKTSFASGSIDVHFANTGHAATVFQVRSGIGTDGPWTYTLGPSANLSDTWAIAAAGQTRYDLSVYGPNGFMRTFKGSVSGQGKANLTITCHYDLDGNAITLKIDNAGDATSELRIVNIYTGHSHTHELKSGMTFERRYDLDGFFGWYDLIVEVPSDTTFQQRLAGHLENGKPGITDPAIGMLT
jgi:phospholipase C